MTKERNLARLTSEISHLLLESIYLIEILEDVLDGDGKTSTLLNEISKKTKKAFNNNEDCRQFISNFKAKI